MSKETWQAPLFAPTEPGATANLLEDPRRFIERAKQLCACIEAFHKDVVQDGIPWPTGPEEIIGVEFPSAWDLHFFLERLQDRAKRGQPVAQHKAVLIEKFEAFQTDAWPFLNPMQIPAERRRQEQREAAAQSPRKAPPDAELLAAYDDFLVRQKGRSKGVTGYLAKKYQMSHSGMTKALRSARERASTSTSGR